MLAFQETLIEFATKEGWEPPTVSVIYDEPNLRRAAKSQLGVRIDIPKVHDFISQKYWNITKSPVVVTDEEDDDKTYVQMLEYNGFQVEQVKGQNKNGIRKSRTDAVISAGLVREGVGESDVIILVSGDGDFAPLLKEIKELFHKKIVVYTVHRTLAYSLYGVADDVQFIGAECGMYKPKMAS